MRIAIITTSYPAFLKELYLNAPGLERKSYSEQLAARNDSLFGFADFYSRGFRAHGHQAEEFHLNNTHLQTAWARENGLAVQVPEGAPYARQGAASLPRRLLAPFKPMLRPVVRRLWPPRLPDWQVAILRAQIEAFQPDILYNQEPAVVRSPLLRTFRAPGRWIVGQIASALPPGEDFNAYDLMVSSLPNFVDRFRSHSVPSICNRLAFEPVVLERVGAGKERDIPISFVGNLSLDHPGRLALLEKIAERLPLKMWGSGIDQLSPSSPLRKCHQGEAWGRAMYDIMARSKLTLNFHASFSGDHANNLRLYEATGMGALLLNDRKRDLVEHFTPGDEVVAYDTPEDCAAKAERLLNNDAERARIAAAGQRRTLEAHNYFIRTRQLSEVFEQVQAGQARANWLAAAPG